MSTNDEIPTGDSPMVVHPNIGAEPPPTSEVPMAVQEDPPAPMATPPQHETQSEEAPVAETSAELDKKEELARLVDSMTKHIDRDAYTITIPAGTILERNQKLAEIFASEISDRLGELLEGGNLVDTYISAIYTGLYKHEKAGSYDRTELLNKEVEKGDEIGASTTIDNVKIGDGTPRSASVSAGEGIDSLMMAHKANKKRVRRVWLPNSGFFVTVEAPTLARLYSFQVAVRNRDSDWGTLLGHHHYYFSSFVVVDEMMSMFIGQVRDSTLVGWQQERALIQSISFNDYEICVAALAALTYPNGYNDYEYACLHEGCTWTKKITLDFTQVKKINFTKMGADAIRFCMRPSVERDDLPKYRALLHNASDTQRLTILRNDEQWTFRVPSMWEYLTAAAAYAAEVTNNVHVQGIRQQTEAMMYSRMRNLAPWVSNIVLTDFPDRPINTASDIARFCEGAGDDYETVLTGEDPWMKKVESFIQASSVSWVAVPNITCGRCGHEIGKPGGFTTLDVQHHFFTIVDRARKLLLNG